MKKRDLWKTSDISSRLFPLSSFSSSPLPSQRNPPTSPHHPDSRYIHYFSPFLSPFLFRDLTSVF